MKRALRIGVAALAVALAAWSARAQDEAKFGCGKLSTREPQAGEVPIDRAPYLIEKPGRYILTADLRADASAIAIQAENVMLDLNGHTIAFGAGVRKVDRPVITYNGRQPGNVGHAGILLPDRPDMTEDFPGFRWNSKLQGIVIGNGKIVDGGGEGLAYCAGINLGGASGAQLEDLVVEVAAPDTFGITVGEKARIRAVTVNHKGTHVTNRHQQVADIELGPASEMSDCRLEGGPQSGVKAHSGAKVHDNLIRQRATVTNCYGVQGYGQKDVQIYNNRIMPHNGRGIHLSEKSQGWSVHDNYVEVRETRNREYAHMQTHGIKMEGTKNSKVYNNVVLAVSSDGGEPTPFNMAVEAGSGNEVYGNTFVAMSINKEGAYSTYFVENDGTGSVVRDNTFYTNNIAVMVSPDGGRNTTFRRCRFRKIDAKDDALFYADRNYQKKEMSLNSFIDCQFLDGLDPRSCYFPGKGADWRSPGGYVVGWSLALTVSDGGKLATGSQVIVSDKDGKEVAKAACDVAGKASVDLPEFRVTYEKAEAKVRVEEAGAYSVKVSAGGRMKTFAVAPKSPMRAAVELADASEAKPAPAAAEIAEGPEPGATRGLGKDKPYWRQRVEEAQRGKQAGPVGVRFQRGADQ